jgi:hypothetical protein
MTATDHIIGIMKNSLSDEEAAQRIADFTERGYNPGTSGLMVRISKEVLMDIQPAEPGMRCTAIIGDDLQSGPLYCGHPADVFAMRRDCPDRYCALCERHARRHGIKIEATS